MLLCASGRGTRNCGINWGFTSEFSKRSKQRQPTKNKNKKPEQNSNNNKQQQQEVKENTKKLQRGGKIRNESKQNL